MPDENDRPEPENDPKTVIGMSTRVLTEAVKGQPANNLLLLCIFAFAVAIVPYVLSRMDRSEDKREKASEGIHKAFSDRDAELRKDQAAREDRHEKKLERQWEIFSKNQELNRASLEKIAISTKESTDLHRQILSEVRKQP